MKNCVSLIGLGFFRSRKSKKIDFKTFSTFFKILDRILKNLFIAAIAIYRSFFTAHFGAGVCRFEPSCSDYANQAFQKLPTKMAFWLTLKRLIKCRPGSSFGLDPIPEATYLKDCH